MLSVGTGGVGFSTGSGQSESTQNSSWSGGSSNSAQSWSNVNGTQATLASQAQAEMANASAMEAWRKATEYNSEEAQKNREWQERMANTQYQRSVNDMIAAGLNPILAASNGIQAGNIGTGAQASIGNPQSFMGQTFAEQNSGSTAYGSSYESGNSSGHSWSTQSSGIADFVNMVKNYVQGVADQTESASQVAQNSAQISAWIKDRVQQESTGVSPVGAILGGLALGMGGGGSNMATWKYQMR